MSQSDEDKKRYRPFRAAAWAVYLVVAVGFSLLVVWSVFSSVLAMTPGLPPKNPELLTVKQCAAGARAMFEELEQQRKGYTDDVATAADRRFLEFRTDWLTRERRLESECGAELADRAELKAAFETLIQVLDHYTTASVQYAGAVGPTVERFRGQLERLTGDR